MSWCDGEGTSKYLNINDIWGMKDSEKGHISRGFRRVETDFDALRAQNKVLAEALITVAKAAGMGENELKALQGSLSQGGIGK